MPLSESAPRSLLHTRHVRFHGYKRDDGWYDIEACMSDVKTTDFAIEGERTWQPGEPIHDMRARITIDTDLVVLSIEVVMEHVPYGECAAARPAVQSLVGCSMRKGWRRAIEDRLGAVRGCTHVRELLLNMGTAAFQTLAPMLVIPDDEVRAPLPLGGCVSWDPAGSMVKRLHPRFHIESR